MMAMVVAIEIAWCQNQDTPKEEPRDQKLKNAVPPSRLNRVDLYAVAGFEVVTDKVLTTIDNR